MKLLKVRSYLPLIAVIILGTFLRFYKLDWGSGYFFHPDEYHIAAAANRLSFPLQMNPELFSYGSFTVYLIYFTQTIITSITSHFPLLKSHFLFLTSYFASAILIGRFYSALFSTLTIILVYFIFHHLLTTPNPTHNPPPTSHYSLLAAALCATLPSLIQQAHFATPESILTFWLLLTVLTALKYLTKKESKYLYLASASQGLALGTKIVAITFLPVVLLPPLFLHLNATTSQESKSLLRPLRGEYFNRLKRLLYCKASNFVYLIKVEFFAIFIALLTFFLSFPYAILDWPSFRSSLNYETGVARGQPVVFYTRQFINTTPVLFQFQKIFPYALGPGVLVLGSLGILGCLENLKKKNSRFPARFASRLEAGGPLLILISFLSYFLPNAFLFAKWTRFMAPVFPFFAIFSAYFVNLIKNKKLSFIIYHLSFIITFAWTAMFFSIYLKPDVRLTATEWLNQNLPANSFIFTESGNMLEVPLEGNLKKTAFDFYYLEENKELQDQLPKLLAENDYFIVQSRRIFANHQRLPEQFPKTAKLYDLLSANQLGFEKIKEFDSFPQVTVHGSRFTVHDEMAEETWSVFDHPVIRIYKKVNYLTQQDYENLLKI